MGEFTSGKEKNHKMKRRQAQRKKQKHRDN